MKEYSTSSIGVESIWVPTEVDYSIKIDPKPKIEELDNIGNAEERRFWNNRGKQILKV